MLRRRSVPGGPVAPHVAGMKERSDDVADVKERRMTDDISDAMMLLERERERADLDLLRASRGYYEALGDVLSRPSVGAREAYMRARETYAAAFRCHQDIYARVWQRARREEYWDVERAMEDLE